MLGLPPANNNIVKLKNLYYILLLLIGARKYYRVSGNSMYPSIASGDLIIYKTISSGDFPLKRGAIVLAEHPLESQTIVIKRVYKHNLMGVDLRGDNKNSSDDSRKFGLINQNQVFGIVEKVFGIDK